MDPINQLNHDGAMIESSYFLHNKEQNEKQEKTGLKKDLKNIIFLIYLYMLQGVPLGLTASMPIILSTRKVSYADQGSFSFATWPFAMKLLWAPIVDSLYIKKFGRRKSWLIPVQLIIGIFLISFADHSQKLAYNIETKTDIFVLTIIFTMFSFLIATQDIALDGWALSMLSKENVSWQSISNGVGQTAGFFIGHLPFIILESKDFCNKYIRPFFNLEPQDYGMVSLRVFMYIFGSIFLITTIAVLILKKENEDESKDDAGNRLSLIESYMVIIRLLKLKPIQFMVLILLTFKLGLATEVINGLKLIENGVSKEKLSLLMLPLAPVNILLPIFISKLVKNKPLMSYIRAYPLRIIGCMVSALFVFYTPSFKDTNDEYPYYYYLLCLVLFVLLSFVETTMFISQMAFFASVSDKTIGGTNMTFLATLANLGSNYPGTVALYLVNFFSVKKCVQDFNFNFQNNTTSYNSSISLNSTDFSVSLLNNKCSSTAESKNCESLGGKCVTQVDAYYYLTIAFAVVGFIWVVVFYRIFKKLSSLPKSKWEIKKKIVNNFS